MTRRDECDMNRDADRLYANETLALDLADLLPGSDDRCADRLTRDLAATPLIDEVHVVDGGTL
ncbi:hypothetical protein, partial [Mycolicibacter minnesotensis]